ncbi:MAG: helix-turn-helix domain-containing protein [Thermoflexibacter sp.]
MKEKYPIYCINHYPEQEHGNSQENTFYIIKLSDLVQGFPNIDKPHTHTFYMFMIVNQGNGKHIIDFVEYPIFPLATFFLTPGQVHSWELSQDIDGYAIFFEANFFIQQYQNRLYEYPFFHSNYHTPFLALEKEATFIQTMIGYQYDCYLDKIPQKQEILFSFLHIILETLSHRYYQQLPKQVSSHSLSKIRQFENLLNQHFQDKKEVSEYADIMHISSNYLNVLCKSNTGKTASQFIQERIITEAKRLLVHSSLSIKEIAFHLGFEDYAYFSRFFKKHTHTTAENFRKNYE